MLESNFSGWNFMALKELKAPSVCERISKRSFLLFRRSSRILIWIRKNRIYLNFKISQCINFFTFCRWFEISLDACLRSWSSSDASDLVLQFNLALRKLRIDFAFALFTFRSFQFVKWFYWNYFCTLVKTCQSSFKALQNLESPNSVRYLAILQPINSMPVDPSPISLFWSSFFFAFSGLFCSAFRFRRHPLSRFPSTMCVKAEYLAKNLSKPVLDLLPLLACVQHRHSTTRCTNSISTKINLNALLNAPDLNG